MRKQSSTLNKTKDRFRFIGHALRGDGPFRPEVFFDQYDRAYDVGVSALIRYPRESTEKFARRNELAWYSSPVYQLVQKFCSYISSRSVQRELPNEIYRLISEDCDGKSNSINVFWQDFMVEAKARGSMFLLVDMPPEISANKLTQMEDRSVPYWTMIRPDIVEEAVFGDDGKLTYFCFHGTFENAEGEMEKCKWHFTTTSWSCEDTDEHIVDEGEHNLGECPVLCFTESGDYPCFGSFAPLSDLAKRLFNLESELDEILRSQTFSLLTMQVPEDTSDQARLEAARMVGETIGTNNMMMHSGSTPEFIAPSDGPAKIYLDRIDQVRGQMDSLGMNIAAPQERESGLAMEMRFHTINAELGRFSGRLEDLERRAWDLTARWLGLQELPELSWPRDFNIADVEKELEVLGGMIENQMPENAIIAQQRKVISVQFAGYDYESIEDMYEGAEARRVEVQDTSEED